MLRVTNKNNYDVYELFGETTDTLPTSFPCEVGGYKVERMESGSSAFLVDTSSNAKSVKFYDANASVWR